MADLYKVLENYKQEIESQQDYLEELTSKMQQDLESCDFEHLSRLAAEASEVKGNINTLKMVIRTLG